LDELARAEVRTPEQILSGKQAFLFGVRQTHGTASFRSLTESLYLRDVMVRHLFRA
jgi:hypothetical protein